MLYDVAILVTAVMLCGWRLYLGEFVWERRLLRLLGCVYSVFES